MSLAHRVARMVATQRRPRRARAAPVRRTFVRLNGVSQHAINTDGIAPVIFPGTPGPGAPGTILWWARGVDPAVSPGFATHMSIRCAAEAYDALAVFHYRPGGSWYLGQNRLRTSPSVTVSGRQYPQTTWPDGTLLAPGVWRLMSAVVTAGSHNSYAHSAFRPAAAATPTADYNNALGRHFVLGGSVNAAGVLRAGTSPALDCRAPAIYLSALSEAQLQAIEAAGPTFNHAANGAAGWWPGDGDTYPVMRNLGSEGAAWDLTLKNGSQSMIMEDV